MSGLRSKTLPRKKRSFRSAELTANQARWNLQQLLDLIEQVLFVQEFKKLLPVGWQVVLMKLLW